MLSRNPALHYVFAQMEMAEDRGLGLRSLRSRAEEARLPLPTYSWEPPYLVLTMYRTRDAAVSALPSSVRRQLSDPEARGWAWMSLRGRAKAREYAEAMGADDRTARRHLNHFVTLGLVRRTGAGPVTVYELR
jgi:ATP-dependent DNA helicase RecG